MNTLLRTVSILLEVLIIYITLSKLNIYNKKVWPVGYRLLGYFYGTFNNDQRVIITDQAGHKDFTVVILFLFGHGRAILYKLNISYQPLLTYQQTSDKCLNGFCSDHLLNSGMINLH